MTSVIISSLTRKRSTFGVHETVTRTLSLMPGSFISHQIQVQFISHQIQVQIDAQTSPVACGYPNELVQLLLNIMTNARDTFEDRMTRSPKMVITIDEKDDKAIVTIADNAGGVPEEVVGKIFDPYFTTKGPQAGPASVCSPLSKKTWADI